MDYTVERMKGFKVIGFEREFSNDGIRIPGYGVGKVHVQRTDAGDLTVGEYEDF